MVSCRLLKEIQTVEHRQLGGIRDHDKIPAPILWHTEAWYFGITRGERIVRDHLHGMQERK
ncbi:hypothetical protein [Paenibacillus bovis]|uniref:hypothetical protein n=1 Tax=Paenibacillus bovis TaxID=1616788 RepID=UPI000A71CFD1|nr:hypothetical protein [Paenibacillus bovis]